MYQHIVIGANGRIDAKQSIIRALNAIPGIEKTVMDIGIVPVTGEHHCFAITFNHPEITTKFYKEHQELGTIDLTDLTNPRILLNKESSFLYLFNQLIKSQGLLENPEVPPFARVNLLKQFAIQALEPLIFHGIRQNEMKVGFEPIQFNEGKLFIRLRGQTPRNINTIVDYDNFDELALVCFTDAEKASKTIPLKQLLFAVKTQYIMEHYKGSLDQQLKLQPLKVVAITTEEMGKRLYLEISSEYSTPKTMKQIGTFKQLLQQTLGDSFQVCSSLHYGRFALEIKPKEGFLFTEAQVALLKRIFEEKADVIFLSSAKQKLIRSLVQLDSLTAEEYEVRYSYDSVFSLAEAFKDPVMRDPIKNAVVIDNSGISFSASTIRSLNDTNNRSNPLTRQPFDGSLRPNKLLEALKEHYSKVPAHIMPPMLEGIAVAVILPNGETVDKATIVQQFIEQNNITIEALQADTTARLSDGSTLCWRDVWPNLAVQQIIGFYNQPLQLNPDERILEHPNPMLSLAATISSLLDSPASLLKDEAEALLESNPMAMPVHVIWGSEPAGLRLNFKSIELERLILCLLTRNNIAAVSSDAMTPFKKCIFLSADSEQGKENIKRFLYDICKYNRVSSYFDSCFSSREFRYDSRTKARKVRGEDVSLVSSSADEASLREEQLVFNFLRAMYYATTDEMMHHYAALPASLKQGVLGFGHIHAQGLTSQAVSRQIPAATFVTSAHTPLSLLSHVSGMPIIAQPSVQLRASMPVDAAPLVGPRTREMLLVGTLPGSSQLQPMPSMLLQRTMATLAGPRPTLSYSSVPPLVVRASHRGFFGLSRAPSGGSPMVAVATMGGVPNASNGASERIVPRGALGEIAESPAENTSTTPPPTP